MKVLGFLLASFLFLSCIYMVSSERICAFTEHSGQIMSLQDGFFAFNIRRYYKDKNEKLVVRYFNRNGRQLCINEVEYPFSFYNFLIREKNSNSVYITSQNRRDGRENLILEISNNCAKINEFRMSSENYETIADIQVYEDQIYVCGWIENRERQVFSQLSDSKRSENKIMIEHDMFFATYDHNFTEKYRVITQNGNSAKYAFSIAPTSDGDRVFYSGSIIEVGVDSEKGQLLKSMKLFLYKDGGRKAQVGIIDGVEYSTNYDLIPFFLKEYNNAALILVSMGRNNANDILAISVIDKGSLSANTYLYPFLKGYLPFYPVLVKDERIYLRFLDVRRGSIDLLCIVDLRANKITEIWLKGADKIAFELNGGELTLYYSVVVRPCGESIYKAYNMLLEELFKDKIAKPAMIDEIRFRMIEPIKNIKNF